MAYISVSTGTGATRGANPTLGPLDVRGPRGAATPPMKRADLRRPPIGSPPSWAPAWGVRRMPTGIEPPGPAQVGRLGEYVPNDFLVLEWSPMPSMNGGGCAGCGGGLGQLDLGTATLPVVGQIDLKTILLVAGVVWAGSMLLGAGRRVKHAVGGRVRSARRRVGAAIGG